MADRDVPFHDGPKGGSAKRARSFDDKAVAHHIVPFPPKVRPEDDAPPGTWNNESRLVRCHNCYFWSDWKLVCTKGSTFGDVVEVGVLECWWCCWLKHPDETKASVKMAYIWLHWQNQVALLDAGVYAVCFRTIGSTRTSDPCSDAAAVAEATTSVGSSSISSNVVAFNIRTPPYAFKSELRLRIAQQKSHPEMPYIPLRRATTDGRVCEWCEKWS